MASQYPGVVEYTKENPLTYKRVKAEFQTKLSNRKSYYYLLRILKKQNNNV